MASNSFGKAFRITTFGESHGKAMGMVIDGCPAGLDINVELIQSELRRRRPAQSSITSARKEPEELEILSGIFEGKTLGTPIAFLIYNKDARPKEYERFRDTYRPSHADFTYEEKYGIRDYRGGGRASARETVNWVAAGAIAKRVIRKEGISVQAYVDRIGDVVLDSPHRDWSGDEVEGNPVRCPDQKTARAMTALIEKTRKTKDSLGGTVFGRIDNCPAGLGEPVFHKFEAQLAKAMLSINASKGFEIGSGFDGAKMKGSEHNDPFVLRRKKIVTETNFSGGIQGGITNGERIYFRVAFKPVATIPLKQKTVTRAGKEIELEGKGRHDPCVLPRAVPVVEAMAALVTADFYLLRRNNRI